MKTKEELFNEMIKKLELINYHGMNYDDYLKSSVKIMFEVAAEYLESLNRR